jgi:hypothetical protein
VPLPATTTLPAFDPPSLSPRAASYFKDVFQARFEQLRAAVPQTPFSVILWGPGPGSLALYNKRVQIRDELRLRQQAAFLAEDMPLLQDLSVMPRLERWMQATAADLIVVLVATTENVAGAHEFSADALIRSKLLLFTPDAAALPEYRSVLEDLAKRYDNVKAFRYPDDITSCHLRALVLDKLGEMQIAKWRATTAVPLPG